MQLAPILEMGVGEARAILLICVCDNSSVVHSCPDLAFKFSIKLKL
jgi:hypothetical protein